MSREEIVREVARALSMLQANQMNFGDPQEVIEAEADNNLDAFLEDAEIAVSLCFARAAEVLSKRADEVFGGGDYYAGKEDGYRAAADEMSDFA